MKKGSRVSLEVVPMRTEFVFHLLICDSKSLFSQKISIYFDNESI